MTSYGDWEAVIGLEIHCQLNTKSLMFGPAPNQFGDEPNINLDFLNTGQPGALPVINLEAVKKGVRFGLAVGAKINLCSLFDRKSYFYPDCPLNYQITQFYKPIMDGGEVEAEVEGVTKTFKIHHAHLENDAGKLIHFPAFTGVDFNRSGAPLIEIVSEPCMHSGKDAAAYGQAIKAIMQYIDSSECNMQEGHFRMDANISVRKKGEKELRTKTEIKNMNSFFNMELAIECEILRQIEFYSNYPDKKLISGTYRFDLEKRKTILMRTKESADDYRYFPEPDLPPLVLSQKFVDDLKNELPELPRAKFQRYVSTLGLSEYSASLLVNDKPLLDDFEEGLKIAKNPKSFCSWLTVEFIGRIKESGRTLREIGILTSHIAELSNLIDEGVITGRIAKSVADDMLANPGKSPKAIVSENPDYQPITDTSTIEPIVDKILASNQASITDYKNGRDKALQYLIGQVMKECKGKATPALTRDLILKKIETMSN
jgi:aspartyl-tRNA(Asn)/glutamyl-tRNA(Gln) amidotransferase subunit B